MSEAIAMMTLGRAVFDHLFQVLPSTTSKVDHILEVATASSRAPSEA